MKKPTVAIQIVSYNALSELEKCLEALSWVAGDKNFHVILIDNASQSDTSGLIERKFPFVNFHANKENFGFAVGQNQAYEISMNYDPDYILLLNPDAIIEKEDIDKLLAKFSSGQSLKNRKRANIRSAGAKAIDKIGIVAPKIVNTQGEVEPSIHIDLNIWMYIFKVFGIKLLKIRTRKMYEIEGFVPSVSGACMLIRNKLIKDIGLFDQDYFFFTEDMDFCLRARKAGWKILFTPEVVVTHARAKSSDSYKNSHIWRRINHYRTQFTYFAKHRGNFETFLLRFGRLIEANIRTFLNVEPEFGQAMKDKLDLRLFRRSNS